LTLVILMLGTNDFQSVHPHNAWHAAQGVAALVGVIRNAPIEPGMVVPPVLLVAPPPIQTPKGLGAPKFSGGDLKCVGLADAYREMATVLGCSFFDAGTVVSASRVDGVHLNAAAQITLGKALVVVARPLLSPV
jgi:lysophospholipase L1-like esterase